MIIAESTTSQSKLPSNLNIWRKLIGNEVFGHSDAVEALPVGVGPAISSFST